MKKIRVFVASPGDVSIERDELSKVIGELNTTVAVYKDCILELVRWETHCSPRMGRPQSIINDQVGSYDIFIGIMWKRFGSPTGKSDSGTEEEFRIAYGLWEENNEIPILFYFSQKPYKLASAEDVQQCGKVIEFRSELESKGLVWEYLNESDFSNVVRPHLARLILDIPEESTTNDDLFLPFSTPEEPIVKKVFIGSSLEGKELAECLADGLNKSGIPAIAWSQGVFKAGEPLVASLDSILDKSRGAVMILTSDDSVSGRDMSSHIPRSNLVYEIGLFHGRHGRNRTFILSEEDVLLPSDLAGVQYFRYDPERLESVIAQIKRQLLSMDKP